jgi:hypothetical protein
MSGGPLDRLVGTWAGEGRGVYPTIEPFGYTEEITFTAVPGKPLLAYQQRTRHATEDRPLHVECGYWRWPGDGIAIEVVLAHPTGITEILEGDLLAQPDGFDLSLAARVVGLSTTAKDVRSTARRFELRGDRLAYTMSMGAVGLPRQHHLDAVLHRR